MIVCLLLLASIPPAWFGGLIPAADSPVVHYTDLAWQPGEGNPADTTYMVYKAGANCAAATAPQFARIASNVSSGPAGLTYRDYSVTAGESVCYYVTSYSSGIESSPSPKVDATTPTTLK